MSFFSGLKLLGRYVRYLLSSTNRHGLQAPFAYQLNEAVIRRDRKEEHQQAIERLRQELLNDHSLIHVRDFGAGFGGKVYKERRVSYITKNSSKPPRYARVLYRLVKHLRPAVILELGTSVGISALYQVAGNASAKVITLEGCPETAALARRNFARFPQYNIQITTGPFDESLPEVLKQIDKIDYLFIDGHHRLEPTLRYINLCYPHLHENAVIIVDDINWSDEMQQAWQNLLSDPRFTLSIDLFMLGILFTSKDLSKENFTVRY